MQFLQESTFYNLNSQMCANWVEHNLKLIHYKVKEELSCRH